MQDLFYTISLALTSSLLLLSSEFLRVSAEDGCSFKHKGCSYNIRLTHKDDTLIQDQSTGCAENTQTVTLDRTQNDPTAKIDDMEKNFTFLKDTHEQRIKELESTVNNLLGGSGPGDKDKVGFGGSGPGDKVGLNLKRTVELSKGAAKMGLGKFPTDPKKDDPKKDDPKKDDNEVPKSSYRTIQISKPKVVPADFSQNNKAVMAKLEDEFEKLRYDLRKKTTELVDTKVKLNETRNALHQAQLEHFTTKKELVVLENQITVLLRERAVLKNQVKDKNYKLDVSYQTAIECEAKQTEAQDKVNKLYRSEATAKEDLLTTQLILNMTKKEMEDLRDKHKALKVRHDKFRDLSEIRLVELLECYSAKTDTFCGFEDDRLCGFTNTNGTDLDFFDWTRAKGRTPSANTGPTLDHTCGDNNGHFMFIEASAKGRGSNAILYSPLYRGMGAQCVEFFYHMHGRHIGTLNVYAQARGYGMQAAWRAFGNQGDIWTNARLVIPKELALAGYKIAFEGITENGYQGDMAIDDISVKDGPCPEDPYVIPVKVEVNSTAIIRESQNFARKIRRKKKRFSLT